MLDFIQYASQWIMVAAFAYTLVAIGRLLHLVYMVVALRFVLWRDFPRARVVRGGYPRCRRCGNTYCYKLTQCLCTWATFGNERIERRR